VEELDSPKQEGGAKKRRNINNKAFVFQEWHAKTDIVTGVFLFAHVPVRWILYRSSEKCRSLNLLQLN